MSGVQTQIDEISIRICNAYGSQKSNLTDAIKLNFWQQLEKQNKATGDVKCETVMEVGPGQRKHSEVIKERWLLLSSFSICKVWFGTDRRTFGHERRQRILISKP